jgi:hypothetical protein
MAFFARLRNGWHLAIDSLKVVKDYPKLLIFPVISGFSMIAILSTFGIGILILMGVLEEGFGRFAVDLGEGGATSGFFTYLGLFLVYFVNFFIAVFFNVGLIHCAREIFEGREPSIREGIRFAAGRIPSIMGWALLAATVGVILKMLEERLGFIGAIVAGILGMAWSITSYFVLPVLAYEDRKPTDALKRSTEIIKEKWGESLGANVSFALVGFLGVALSIGLGVTLMAGLEWIALGIITLVGGIVLTILATTTAHTIFLAAAYEHTQGITPSYFREDSLDNMFIQK